jgi:hypothetical protein
MRADRKVGDRAGALAPHLWCTGFASAANELLYSIWSAPLPDIAQTQASIGFSDGTGATPLRELLPPIVLHFRASLEEYAALVT